MATKLNGHIFVPDVQEVSGDMPIKWEGGLSSNATIINDRRIASVSNDGVFNTKMVIPSSAGFAPMVASGFISKSERTATMIKQKQYFNLSKSFGKWAKALDLSFATVGGVVAARFKEMITNKKDNWASAVANATLRLTGDKIRGRGVSAIAAYLLVGDSRAMGMLRPGDTWISGSAWNIARIGERPAVKAAIQQALIQTGMNCIISNYDVPTMLAQNNILASLLTGLADVAKSVPFVNPADPASSFAVWTKDPGTGKFYLDLQVAA